MSVSEHELIPYHAERSPPRGRALILAPHPDDEVLGCGGAIMRHIAARDPVRIIVVTDGAYGQGDARIAHMRLRQQESACAAAMLGCDDLSFWELPDRGLEYGEMLVERIRLAIREADAALVYAPSWWEMHPDHFALALAAAEAVRRSGERLRLLMYEIGVPLHPTMLLDISDIVERKMAAIGCFRSQLDQQAYDRQILALNTYRTYTLGASVTHAEAYRALTAAELAQDPLRSVRPGIYYAQTASASSRPSPMVSVILTGSDAERRRATLDSLLLQTYPSIEALVVGDTSGDSIPDQSPGARLQIRLLDADAGCTPAKAANAALAQARGDYIVILEDGAILEASHIAAMIAALTASEDSRAIYGNVRPGTPVSAGTIDALAIWSGVQIPLSGLMLARSLVDEGCRLDERLSRGWSWDFLVQITTKTRLTHLDRHSVHILPARTGEDEPSRWSGQAPEEALLKWLDIWDPRRLAEILGGRNRRAAEADERAKAQDSELEAYRKRSAGCEDERAQLRQHIADGDARRAGLQAELDAERRRAHLLESQLAEASARLEALAGEVQAITRSTSWRMTAPLRYLVERARR